MKDFISMQNVYSIPLMLKVKQSENSEQIPSQQKLAFLSRQGFCPPPPPLPDIANVLVPINSLQANKQVLK